MKKIIIQGILIVAAFFATWFLLKNIDWMDIFNAEEKSEKTEEKLGDLFWEMIEKTEHEVKNTEITAPIDSLLRKICTENGIERGGVKLHVVKSDDVNAFALPNKHLVIFTGLAEASENEAALSGVIGHELAHIELNHVMKKLIKEIGLSVLISMTTGNSAGGEGIKEAARLLSSSAYDRKLEKEADIKAVDYLSEANIPSGPFADFLYSISDHEPDFAKNLTWVSTHPDSKERAKYILEYSQGKAIEAKDVLAPGSWDNLKQALQDYN